MITAYTLIYTSLLIISGCLQRADASTSHVWGAAEGSSTVSTPPGPPLRRSRPAWEQKSEAAEHETAFSHQVKKHTRIPPSARLLDFLFSLKHLKNHP